jgi:hypothetical protein
LPLILISTLSNMDGSGSISSRSMLGNSRIAMMTRDSDSYHA